MVEVRSASLGSPLHSREPLPRASLSPGLSCGQAVAWVSSLLPVAQATTDVLELGRSLGVQGSCGKGGGRGGPGLAGGQLEGPPQPWCTRTCRSLDLLTQDAWRPCSSGLAGFQEPLIHLVSLSTTASDKLRAEGRHVIRGDNLRRFSSPGSTWWRSAGPLCWSRRVLTRPCQQSRAAVHLGGQNSPWGRPCSQGACLLAFTVMAG